MKQPILTILVLLLASLAADLHAESGLIDVLHYRAVIVFDLDANEINGSAELLVRNAARGDLESLSLDLRDLVVSSVQMDGNTTQFRHEAGLLTITPAAPIPAGDTVTIAILYGGAPTSEAGPFSWGGCHWGDVSYVLGVGFYAPYVSMMRHWLPSNDIPSDKATFDITYDVPEGKTVAATGILVSTLRENGRTSFQWIETDPASTYLVTYAISDYAVVRDTWESIPMEYYVPEKDSARAVAFFATVPGMMEAFTSYFGAYPFNKVGYCVTPKGSMEHQNMISYAAPLFENQSEAGIVAAHELSHQWWGDWVTPNDFRDAWLNEGFAVFSEALYREYHEGRSGYLSHIRSVQQSYRNTIAPREGMFPLFDYPRTPPS